MSSQLGKLEILQLFKTNILKFFDALIELFPDESDLIVLRILLENQIPVEDALRVLASRIIPVKQMIKDKNERFFLEDNDIFAGIQAENSAEKVMRWKRMWTSKRIDNKDKEAIWRWMSLFLVLAEQYESSEKKLQKL